ncbi:hypothetical protein E4T56_gene3190 [Termitomyces sp. T112]|nr:hypothetical protein C0989_009616 [Termitomyces sp. Mn162]KAG5729122.1 hypothetical protein E4T56_gene3190 [Termitomyces sp. T112]KAH0582481.1 hypothetical protein H2248_010425 [Termitomyces sp. 'cryptogamus']
MLVPFSLSASDAQSHTSVDNKYPSQHLLLRQPYTVQIIQLVEGPPPPPRIKISSAIGDTSSEHYYSSSYSSSAEDNNADNESACSSYCSSDIPPEQSGSQLEKPSNSLELSRETFSVTKRILAWRENFSAHMSATASEVSLPSTLKRKIRLAHDDDIMSRSSKRSRSQTSQGDASVLSLGVHSCPACDASFTTLQSLRQHGHDARANEACCVAVEYAFE